MTGPKHYQLVGPAPHTGAVAVWRGWDPGLRRFVALKQAPVTAVDAAERLRAEARVLGGLDHRHIVLVFDLVETPDAVWLVEEWVDGVTIPVLLHSARTLTVRQSVGVLHGALEGLAYVHGCDVVHGDVSPSNILVDDAGVSKLVDFGAASTGASRAVRVSGTPGYMSPQVASGDLATRRDDVYSVAAVAAMLLRGRPLFVGPTAEAVIAAQLRAPEPDLGGVARAMRDVLARALSSSPKRRFADGAEFLDAVEEAADDDLGRGWLADASIAGLVAAAVTTVGVTIGNAVFTPGHPVPPTAPPPAPPTAPPAAPPAGSTAPAGPPPSPPPSAPPPAGPGRPGRPPRAPRGRPQLQNLLQGRAFLVATGAAVAVLFVAAVFIGYRVSHDPTAPPSPRAAVPATGRTSLGASPSSSTTPRPAAFTWSQPLAIDQLGLLSDVSCATALYCAAVDGAGNAFIFDGTRWSSATSLSVGSSVSGPEALVAVSCPEAGRCVALSDYSSNVFVATGAAWSSQGTVVDASVNPEAFADGLSCPEPTFCVAALTRHSTAVQPPVDVDPANLTSVMVRYDGRNWGAPTPISNVSYDGLGPVSCASQTLCIGVAYDYSGANGLTVYSGGKWSAVVDVDAGVSIDSVSCAEVNFCVAIDANGRALTFDGSRWSEPVAVSDTGLSSVSCAAAGRCVAVGAGGVVASLDNGVWSVGTTGSSSGRGVPDLTRVSCATVNFCVAIDFGGDVVVGT